MIARVPQTLRDKAQWVLWKYLERDGKQTKVPFMPSGNFAKSTSPETWSTIGSCLEHVNRYDGVGFVFSESDCFIGVDLDGCVNPETGAIQDWAREVITRLGSYAEISPSGTGVKIFGSTGVRWPHRKKIEVTADKVCDKNPAIEVYDSGRYFCVTGKRLKGMVDVVPIDEHFDWLDERFGMAQQVTIVDGAGVRYETSVSERASAYLAKMAPSVSGSGGHNRLFAAACAMIKGFELSEAETASKLKYEFNPRCQPEWNDRQIDHKVKQAVRQPGASGYLRDARPDDWSKIRLPGNYREEIEKPAEQEKPEVRVVTIRDAADKYLEELKAGGGLLVETGIPQLDYNIGGGVAYGEMIVVAARPSHGKSMVALQMAHHMSKRGLPVAMVSEEMSALALGKRAIQFASDVPEEDWENRFDEVTGDLKDHFGPRADVIIIESCGTVERACEEIERLVNEKGVKVAIVDYAQLLRSKGANRYEQISRVSQTLRILTSKLQIILVLLAQLNRSIEERPKFLPKMSDIKETGQLEQDADVILFGVWPHRVDPTQDAKNYQFFIGKNRNRRINDAAFVCDFNPVRQKLSDKKLEVVEWTGDFR